jgi:site-specific DNA recombinase
VLDELARHGVSVRFTDAPPLDDDPQARLLTQVQGVIAEYERAKIAERYRRGKLFRSRAGEVLAWRCGCPKLRTHFVTCWFVVSGSPA